MKLLRKGSDHTVRAGAGRRQIARMRERECDTKRLIRVALVLISTLGGIAVLGVNGFVIGPVIAALFVTVWEIFGTSRVRPDAPPEAVPVEAITGAQPVGPA